MSLNNDAIFILIIAIILVLFIIANYTGKLSNKEKEYKNLIKSRDLEFDKREAELKVQSQQWAFDEFEKFKKTELENIKKIIEENSLKAAMNLLKEWKIENEAKIRQNAANRSYSVVLGQVTEHLIPFHERFPFNPKDARFLGSPVDLIVFDGLSDNEDEINIYFVEIKTGKSRFSARQNKIKDAVATNRIVWYPISAESI